jgi:hypothetical protein
MLKRLLIVCFLAVLVGAIWWSRTHQTPPAFPVQYNAITNALLVGNSVLQEAGSTNDVKQATFSGGLVALFTKDQVLVVRAMHNGEEKEFHISATGALTHAGRVHSGTMRDDWSVDRMGDYPKEHTEKWGLAAAAVLSGLAKKLQSPASSVASSGSN